MDVTRHPSATHVGPVLRRWRLLRGLTLNELATQAGCSESMLSKIETMHVNPSLKLARNLAQALGVNVSALFASDSGDDVVSRAGERPVLATDGLRSGAGVALERLTPFHRDSLLQANIHVVEAGGSSDGQITHAGEEVGYLMEGTLELLIDERTYLVRAGDSFHFRSERPHGYRNPGPGTARVIWVSTPPTY